MTSTREKEELGEDGWTERGMISEKGLSADEMLNTPDTKKLRWIKYIDNEQVQICW